MEEKKSYRRIGRELGRSHTTIQREVSRNSIRDKRTWWEKYKAIEAESKRLERREKANRGHVILLKNKRLYKKIEDLLKRKWWGRFNDKEKWWINEIVGRLWLEGKWKISSSTVYNFINKYCLKWKKYLRFGKHGYRKRKGKQWLNKLIWVPLIDERPEYIDKRNSIWHWEVDMVVWPRWELWWLVTLVERYSRYTRIMKVSRSKKRNVYSAMYCMLRNEKVKTVTSDNWSEFALLKLLEEKLKIKVYRCHPYSSREKWSNEKNNGFIRRFCPKKLSIHQYDDKYIRKIEYALNNKPRKILWYKTPYEVYNNTFSNLI